MHRPHESSNPHRRFFLGLVGLGLLLGLLSACGGGEPETAAATDAGEVVTPEPAATGESGTEAMSETEEVAVVTTNHGTMVFRFFPEQAPLTVAHVKTLIAEGFFDGKSFYRVVAGHVIQGGEGFDTEGGPTVVGEFGAHPHVTGAVGLARDEDPDSGSTEIYICLEPRPHLDGSYAIFGLLTEGFDVLAAIGAVEVEELWDGEVAFHRPLEPVVIETLHLETRRLETGPATSDSP